MASLEEHIEAIIESTGGDDLSLCLCTEECAANYHARAALAILRFKPLDEDISHD